MLSCPLDRKPSREIKKRLVFGMMTKSLITACHTCYDASIFPAPAVLMGWGESCNEESDCPHCVSLTFSVCASHGQCHTSHPCLRIIPTPPHTKPPSPPNFPWKMHTCQLQPLPAALWGFNQACLISRSAVSLWRCARRGDVRLRDPAAPIDKNPAFNVTQPCMRFCGAAWVGAMRLKRALASSGGKSIPAFCLT